MRRIHWRTSEEKKNEQNLFDSSQMYNLKNYVNGSAKHEKKETN